MVVWIATAVTLGVAVLLGRTLLLARRARSWPLVDAVITRSELEVDEGYDLRVEYRYTIGPHTYTGDRVRFGGLPGMLRKRNADALAARYPQGGRIAVRVDPASPGRAVIELGVGSPIWALFVTCALAELVAVVEHLRA